MGTPNSKEYDRLKERGFKPYSAGHRRMYELAIERMGNEAGPRGARVLEAGFGIGWGLDEMVRAEVLKSYVGYEPNKDSFDYVQARYPDRENMLLLPLTFEPNLDPAFDYALCIEVIEHVPMEDHARFLLGLRSMAPTLFLSTPDITRHRTEGVRTEAEWVALLHAAGFSKVATDSKSWTTFYWCKR